VTLLKFTRKKKSGVGIVTMVFDLHTGHSSSVGVPNTLNIVFSWSISLSPGKYGILSISSANMHPTDHISTAVL